MHTENEVLEACLARLRTLDVVERVDLKEPGPPVPPEVDAKLVVHTRTGRLVYWVEVKQALNAPRLEHLLLQLSGYAKKVKERPLLFSDYITRRFAERLIQEGVNFVDTAGNMYINALPKLYIHIQGMRPQKLPETKGERLSQPSGLKVVYTLLIHGPTALKSYRKLAKDSGVALGSVAIVVKELKAKGYLIQTGADDWRLTRKKELLDLWVGGYGVRLRPKLVLGRYQPPETDLSATLKSLQSELEETSWALTGGFAADLLTKHYRGNQLGFFVQEWPSEFVRRLKWLPSAQGPVVALRQFSPLVVFNLDRPHVSPVAHPLLVYAELVFQGKERERETARILYDRYLTGLINADGS